MDRLSLKPIYWMGDTLRELRRSPEEVKHSVGYALELVQRGRKPANAKPLKGFREASVLEIIADHSAGWRTIYTVEIADTVYVLHFFQKKSTRGIATPQRHIDLVTRRLREARQFGKRGHR